MTFSLKRTEKISNMPNQSSYPQQSFLRPSVCWLSGPKAFRLKGAIWSLSNWKLKKANKVHTGQEIELLENISQQLKSILAKFHTVHLKNRKKPSKSNFQSMNEKISPGADLSNQTMSKMRVEILRVAWHKRAMDWEGRSNTFLSASHKKLSIFQFQILLRTASEESLLLISPSQKITNWKIAWKWKNQKFQSWTPKLKT